MTLWLYALQRGSALILAPLVLAHLVLIVIVSRDGLSAAEILARTQGSAGSRGRCTQVTTSSTV